MTLVTTSGRLYAPEASRGHPRSMPGPRPARCCLEGEAMHGLDHERPVERTRKGVPCRKSIRCGGIRRVAGVPHQIDVVPDLRNPVNAEVEIDPPTLVVEL